MGKTLLLIVSYLLVLSCQPKFDSNRRISKELQFKEGQVWEYETRVGEESSRVTILRVEEYPKDQVVVHIAVNNVKIKSPTNENGLLTSIEHLPFDKNALEKSVTQLVLDNQPIPDFKEAYEGWKLLFEEGDAGVFSISVKEAVAYIQETMRQE